MNGWKIMSSTFPAQFDNVSAVVKANIYFDGKVVSHTLYFQDGSKKTLGLIYPGSFHFNTGAPERMDIVSGSCRVKAAGQDDWSRYKTGDYFQIAGNSSFDIEVEEGVTEYICSFLG